MERENLDKILTETFHDCCKLILKDNLKDHEFEFVRRSMINFIEYISEKRRAKDYI